MNKSQVLEFEAACFTEYGGAVTALLNTALLTCGD
jgi:hypothetical protein